MSNFGDIGNERVNVLSLDLPFAWRLLSGSDEGRLSVQNLGRILRGFGKNPSDQEVQFLMYDHRLNGTHTHG